MAGIGIARQGKDFLAGQGDAGRGIARHGKDFFCLGTARGSARRGTAWLGTARHGTAWLGKARLGTAWHGKDFFYVLAWQDNNSNGEENMRIISVKIQGVTPLLCNKFGDEEGLNQPRSSLVGDLGTPRELAGKRLYISASTGLPIIPGPNLFRSLIDAGRFFKSGKSTITTIKTSLVPAALAVNEIEMPILHNDPWEVDTRAVKIPATGGRILRSRPCFYDWGLEFSLTLEDTIITMNMTRELVDAAGLKIGLGDFRVACKGAFGKFKVVEWHVE